VLLDTQSVLMAIIYILCSGHQPFWWTETTGVHCKSRIPGCRGTHFVEYVLAESECWRMLLE